MKNTQEDIKTFCTHESEWLIYKNDPFIKSNLQMSVNWWKCYDNVQFTQWDINHLKKQNYETFQ